VSFVFHTTRVPGLLLVEPKTMRDARGFFRETFRLSEFAAHGIPAFVQDNTSHSIYGVLRGLHYQKRAYAQGKYIAAYAGRILDVAVDIRRGSPTYGEWVGVELSDENGLALYVPPGLAHGFCVLSERATINYKVTSEYHPEAERGVLWNDPAIGIDWPIAQPVLSPRDSQAPVLARADNDFVFESRPTRRAAEAEAGSGQA
jgi:dTDP-4-dehydrorhamnose 3,5-epimerase